jgi:TRAP-type mannitol/chloroaromatic compound transport system substrate-binding protein
MDRRTLLTSVAVGLAAGAGAGAGAARLAGPAGTATSDAVTGGPAITGQVKRLNMVTAWPRGMLGTGDAAERVAARVQALSGGSLEIKVYAAGELVGPLEVFDAVATGSADLYHAADYYWQGKDAAYPFFTSVPFGMNAAEVGAWIDHGGGQQLWDELAGQFGIVPIAASNTGNQAGGWFRREIRSLADMRGLKMRIPGVGGEMVRRLGGAAVLLPAGEIFQSLQSGVIDAAEFIGPWNDIGLGFYREAPYYHGPGLHEPGAMLTVGVNRKAWDGLGAEHQAMLRSACRDAYDWSLALFNWHNAQALNAMGREHGIVYRPFPPDVVAEAARVSYEIWAEAGSQSALGRRILDSYVAGIKAMRPWMEASEAGYLDLRRSAPLP